MPPIGSEKDAFSRMDVAFMWSHECPAGCEKTGRTTIFHSFLRTKKLQCLCQLSSLAFLRFLPLFQISADFKLTILLRVFHILSQSRTQSPRAFWPAGERPERLWDNRLHFPRKRGSGLMTYG